MRSVKWGSSHGGNYIMATRGTSPDNPETTSDAIPAIQKHESTACRAARSLIKDRRGTHSRPGNHFPISPSKGSALSAAPEPPTPLSSAESQAQSDRPASHRVFARLMIVITGILALVMLATVAIPWLTV